MKKKDKTPVILVRSQHNDLEVWTQKGFEPVPCTLLTPVKLKVQPPDWSRFSGVILSSVYSSEIEIPPELPIFCVGEKLGQMLKVPAERRFSSMKNLCMALSSMTFQLPLLYIRGETVALNPKDLLPYLKIENLIVYKMNATKSHPALTMENGVVVFYSGENARAFFQVFPDFPYQSFVAICLGDHTAQVVREANWCRLEVATEPNIDALSACILRVINSEHTTQGS